MVVHHGFLKELSIQTPDGAVPLKYRTAYLQLRKERLSDWDVQLQGVSMESEGALFRLMEGSEPSLMEAVTDRGVRISGQVLVSSFQIGSGSARLVGSGELANWQAL